MKKQHLDHVLRAAGRITGEKQFVIIGSQSLHGKYPDLVIAKYVARREKDIAFNRALARRGIVTRERLLQLLEKTPVSTAVRERMRGDIASDFHA